MKRALLIGIDEYDRFGGLDGCVNDVNMLEPLLSRNDDDTPNFDCQKRTSTTGGVTRDELLGDIGASSAVERMSRCSTSQATARARGRTWRS